MYREGAGSSPRGSAGCTDSVPAVGYGSGRSPRLRRDSGATEFRRAKRGGKKAPKGRPFHPGRLAKTTTEFRRAKRGGKKRCAVASVLQGFRRRRIAGDRAGSTLRGSAGCTEKGLEVLRAEARDVPTASSPSVMEAGEARACAASAARPNSAERSEAAEKVRRAAAPVPTASSPSGENRPNTAQEKPPKRFGRRFGGLFFWGGMESARHHLSAWRRTNCAWRA